MADYTELQKPLKGEDWLFELAKSVSRGATCTRASVGAVIAIPETKNVLSMGFNGAPAGYPECVDVGCKVVNDHCQRVIHAETNAVGWAAKWGISVVNATMYVYFGNHNPDSHYPIRKGEYQFDYFPCYPCWQAMTAAGIKEVRLRDSSGPTCVYRYTGPKEFVVTSDPELGITPYQLIPIGAVKV